MGKGKPVLILPGWGTTIDTYSSLINSLSIYSTVYCLDMPGFGDTEEPHASWNLDKYVEFVINFIQQQGIEKLDLIGHSNGGRIIIKLMNNPNLNFKVNKIILIGSAGIVHTKTFFQKIKIKTYKILKKIVTLQPIKILFPNLLLKLKNKFGSADYKNASPVMRETLVKLINEDVKHCLSQINSPTLLIWGENDTATPLSDGELMAKLIPDSGLVKIENCSHYVFLERAYYVNKIIHTFLNGGN